VRHQISFSEGEDLVCSQSAESSASLLRGRGGRKYANHFFFLFPPTTTKIP
jgi:hypothetical protein